MLDRLASEGLRFAQFYNTAKCHSSRVSLLTGRWCRQAGDESMKRAVTIPEILRSAGYFTAMSGKWHLSNEPTDFEFDRFFGHLSGACHFFKGDKTFRLNGEPWEVPTDGFYTTIAKVDFALKFLEEARGTDKPWFLYLAFNAPFRFYKQNQYEGGIATPAIAHWPARIKTKPGSIDATPAHLVDLLPTLLDVTGTENLETFPGREPSPLAGISLAPLFAGEKISARPPLHFLHDSDRALRDGDWKIVSFRSGPWELYNLADDRTELHDLAEKHPERVSQMTAEWHRMAKDVLMATPREQRPVAGSKAPKTHPEWFDYSGKKGDNTSRRHR